MTSYWLVIEYHISGVTINFIPHLFESRDVADKFCHLAGRNVSMPRRLLPESAEDGIEAMNERPNFEARFRRDS